MRENGIMRRMEILGRDNFEKLGTTIFYLNSGRGGRERRDFFFGEFGSFE